MHITSTTAGYGLGIALALLGAACGGGTGGTGVTNPAPPRASDDPTTAVFGGGPPRASLGERMGYRLSLRGIELAALQIAIGDVQELNGKQAIVVQSHVQSTGLANMVSTVDDHFTTWLEVATGRSLRFQADEQATANKADVEHVVVEIASRTGTTVPVTFAVNDASPTTDTPQTVSMPDLWDFNSFLIALRSWEPAVGATVAVEAMRSRWMWHLETKFVGAEQLETELGALPALKFETHSRKLGRDGQRTPNNADRDFTIYISDDADRVPLLVTAASDYGDVKLEIVDYQAGASRQ